MSSPREFSVDFIDKSASDWINPFLLSNNQIITNSIQDKITVFYLLVNNGAILSISLEDVDNLSDEFVLAFDQQNGYNDQGPRVNKLVFILLMQQLGLIRQSDIHHVLDPLFSENYLMNRDPMLLKWSWHNQRCNNDDTYNVVEDVQRYQMDKNDPDDPVISFGTDNNYNCYKASELASAMIVEDGTFHFYIPDSRPLSEFSELNAKDLHELISVYSKKNTNIPPILQEIMFKLEFGLTLLQTANISKSLRSYYDELPRSQEEVVELYLAWLFLFSMWVRFWNGPGTPYPYSPDSSTGCVTEKRNSHVRIQLGIYEQILNIIRSIDPTLGLYQWIIYLPKVRYNWKLSNGASLGSVDYNVPAEKTNTVTKIIARDIGKCLGGVGAQLPQSAYGLIKIILGLDDLELNEFIRRWLPTIEQLEYNFVTQQINYLDSGDQELKVYYDDLTRRQFELLNLHPLQPNFDPKLMGRMAQFIK